MSVPVDFAEQQVRRLSGLRGFPRTSEGVLELVRALSNAADRRRADNFVSDWLRENQTAPAPADIYQTVARRTEYWERPPLEAVCAICYGCGWEIIERHGLTGAQICRCKKAKPQLVRKAGP